MQYHIISDKKGWSVVKQGTYRAFRIFRMKSEAITFTRTIKNVTTIVVHDNNGGVERTINL